MIAAFTLLSFAVFRSSVLSAHPITMALFPLSKFPSKQPEKGNFEPLFPLSKRPSKGGQNGRFEHAKPLSQSSRPNGPKTGTLQAALEQLDADQWRRMQSAYRVHKAKGRTQAAPQLKEVSWHKLELIRRRLGVLTLDDAVERLASVPDLGGVVRVALK